MSFFSKTKVDGDEKRSLGEGVFERCTGCGQTARVEDFAVNLRVCPECGFHAPLAAQRWVQLLIDESSWAEEDADLKPADPLSFHDSKPYKQRIEQASETSGLREALLAGSGTIEGHRVQFGCFAFHYMGGSMGAVVGEKIARLMERGVSQRQPVVLLSASGGARMQEGPLSLMQMAKTVAALTRLRDAGVPFISVLLNPTTGGVAASFALQGDVNIAEPGALIGFAGPRVIEDTIQQQLPDGFQRSEFLLEHGMVDLICTRHEMKHTLARTLGHLVPHGDRSEIA